MIASLPEEARDDKICRDKRFIGASVTSFFVIRIKSNDGTIDPT